MEGERELHFPRDVAGEITARRKFPRMLAKFHSPIALDFAGHANDSAIARISVEYRDERHSDATTREIFGFASKYRYRSENSSYPPSVYVTYDRKSQCVIYVLFQIEIRGFSRREAHIHPNVLAYN